VGWIGKAGMVREPEFYVGADSPHAHRSEVATEDRSWSAMNVDIAAKIAEIARFNHWVDLQLEFEAGFGLRGREARQQCRLQGRAPGTFPSRRLPSRNCSIGS
jgi:hypothetical protein